VPVYRPHTTAFSPDRAGGHPRHLPSSAATARRLEDAQRTGQPDPRIARAAHNKGPTPMEGLTGTIARPSSPDGQKQTSSPAVLLYLLMTETARPHVLGTARDRPNEPITDEPAQTRGM